MSVPRVVSRRELDPLRCGRPGCDCPGPLVLTSRCHPRRPVIISYDWTTGLLTVRCARCEAWIADIAVAAEVRL